MWKMLVNQRGCVPNSETQVSVWDEEHMDKRRISSWFKTEENTILDHQLKMAQAIKSTAGPETIVAVLQDGAMGFCPREAMTVTQLEKELIDII